jgi:hypothetical protein
MRKIAVLIAVLGTILLPVLCTVPAHAQATRTWVSGVGDDANPCSRTAPCMTFAGAISKTAAGGEIDALDPAGYGTLTITKSITIDGGGGQVASVMASSGANGITVNAGATDIVTIRNVQFQGDLGNGGSPNTAGLNGILFNSGAMLSIDNCKIDGFANGGIVAGTSANAILNVTSTVITNSQTGIGLVPLGGALNGSIDHTTIRKMSTNGSTAFGTVYFTVTNSAIVNAAGSGVIAGTGAVLEIDSSSVTNNNTAFTTQGGIIRISRNTIYDNNTNFSISGGTIATGGNNFVAVNGSQAPNGSITQQ